MLRPSVIPGIKARLEAYLNQKEVECIFQSNPPPIPIETQPDFERPSSARRRHLLFSSERLLTVEELPFRNLAPMSPWGRFLPVGLENTGYLPTLFQKLRRMGC